MITISKNAQGTQEWLADRIGLLTASNATAIGNNGKGLDTYINNIMAEKYSSAIKENFTNEDMERGKELEEQARELYSLTTGREVKEVGFMTNSKYKLAGASLDGLTEDGGIEIKCLKDSKHFEQMLLDEIKVESKYMWQVQMQMMITEKKWTDYILYNPNYEESLLIKRVEIDKKYTDKLKIGLLTGAELIKKIELKINN